MTAELEHQVMRRDLHRVARRRGDWRALAERSAAEVQRRRALVPEVAYPDDLPITRHLPEIGRLLARHQVVVVAGETGSGKTTQLPKLCLEAGFGVSGAIAHTQPRRIAARTVAARIAAELGVPLGAQVGYAVRFAETTGPDTLIKLLTDGLLLAELRSDRWLTNYEVVIVDEAHERSLNIDFLLGVLKSLTARRPDLRVIVTSATIDVDAFSRHFADAPVVQVEGRSYPVAMRYTPSEAPLEAAVLDCLRDIETQGGSQTRDVLVFHSGEREILTVARHLRRNLDDRWEVLPLYARLSTSEQLKVFQVGRRRRVVLATNVAETSLTVPNIGYVIDPGFARLSRYSYRSKLQRLPVEPISKASAIQRAGRAGRIADGVCYRLFDEADFEGRPDYTDPEIRRTNLASVILQMHDLRLGAPTRFPFLDPPDPKAFTDGERLLAELNALDGSVLTELGRTLSRIPLDPRLARMLPAAAQLGSLREVLVIVTGLSVQDPRLRPMEKRAAADAAHRQFADKRSDFLFYVNLWQWVHAQRQILTRRRFERLLGQNYLSPSRIREWQSLHAQIRSVCRVQGLSGADPAGGQPADYASVHQALLAGSLGMIGRHDERGEYMGARQTRFRIFPGSTLYGSTPRWVVAAEIVETSRVYARCVGTVEPAWIESAAGHLIRRTHAEPHWSARRGEAMAYETVMLYGLTLIERRRVRYAPIDPATSRNLMIRDGLLAGGVRVPLPFLTHNLEVIRSIRELEAKGRRRDLLLGDAELCAFYESRLPDDVLTVRQLDRWLRRQPPDVADGLLMRESDVMAVDGVQYTETEFPSSLDLRDAAFELKYRFAPGAVDDGVSLQVPAGMLPAVIQEPLDWLVPGMFPALCEALVKSLPKQWRRRLAPVPDNIPKLLPVLAAARVYRSGRLLPALTEAIDGEFGFRIPADAWAFDRLPENLRMNVQVFGDGGRLVDQGRSVEVLKSALKQRLDQTVRPHVADDWVAAGITTFPERLPASYSARGVVAYPALVDRGDCVDVQLLDDPVEQLRCNRDGYTRLARVACAREAGQFARKTASEQDLCLHYAPLGGRLMLEEQVCHAVFWHTFFEAADLPDTRAAFQARISERRPRLMGNFETLLPWLKSIMAGRFEVSRKLGETRSPAFAGAVADARAHLDRLVPATVLTTTPWESLAGLPRYLDAISHRLDHLQGRVDRDAALTSEVSVLEQRLATLGAELGTWHPRWLELRFMLEELRVALFAEPLGAAFKVSIKRVERALVERERECGLR